MNYSLYDEAQIAPSEQFITFSDLISTIWRGRWIIVAAIILALGGAIAYLMVATPSYTASARLLIDPRQIDPIAVA